MLKDRIFLIYYCTAKGVFILMFIVTLHVDNVIVAKVELIVFEMQYSNRLLLLLLFYYYICCLIFLKYVAVEQGT